MTYFKKWIKVILILAAIALGIWSWFEFNKSIQQEQLGIRFQALLLNDHGQLVFNQAVSMEFMVLPANDTNEAIYTERRCLLSNERGELICKIGGNDTANKWSCEGQFENINWQNSSYFLQITTDGIKSKPLISVPLSEKDPQKPGNIQVNIFWKPSAENAAEMTSSKNQKDAEEMLYIGKHHQGGKIAYLYQRGDSGYIEGEIHGIIAAEHDLPKTYSWGCEGVLFKALRENKNSSTSQASSAMEASNCEGAMSICDDWVSNNLEDWRLPSLSEMEILYRCQCCIGGWEGGQYWTNEELDANAAYMFYLGLGHPQPKPKHFQAYVRPIRNF